VTYLIDTNVISEVRKGARCDAHVSAWYASIADEDLFLSTLVLGEIRKGVELARLGIHIKPRRSNAGCGTWNPHSTGAFLVSTTPSPANGAA
jgi:predicted nucleic acid-binding protein